MTLPVFETAVGLCNACPAGDACLRRNDMQAVFSAGPWTGRSLTLAACPWYRILFKARAGDGSPELGAYVYDVETGEYRWHGPKLEDDAGLAIEFDTAPLN